MIEYEEVKKELKLNVEELSKESMKWQKVWELFVRSLLHVQVNNNAKLFESNSNSLGMTVNVLLGEPKTQQR